MTRANFYRTSLLGNHEENLLSISRTISETIEIASGEFLRICSELVTYAKHPIHREHVSQAVRELQFADALSQKLQHVLSFIDSILLGESIENEEGEKVEIRNVMGSVLRLNYYQVIATQDDFTRVVQKVQMLMRKFRSFEDTTSAFMNFTKIHENFRVITTSLNTLADQYVASADFDLSEITDYFSDRYSMLSERLVLNWCVSCEYESTEEFRKYYALQDAQGTVELF
jgi:hypothetical protein